MLREIARPGCVWLGSRLRIEPGFIFEPTAEGGELKDQEFGQTKVRITVDSELSTIREIAPQVIEIVPNQAEKSGTTQWKYRFSLQR